ncbi:uncharacterized protein LOC102803409 [Saccoglossus kowalevskii]|uniref:Uncharacterized protein LOC102803409 n=1 Tax=Saccoglossus kowalevskii TaxID=10224 RepID=A0ABM0M8I6_SACKO|nr:PREDICTED: uncharacterized protein LOC102803409 [Saccoglossus kowalevskii]
MQEECPNVDSSTTKSGSTWYLPHHPVIHSNKPEKVRVVFDCAAKYQGTSLNDQLLQGPDLNNTLVGVLLQFRKEPVAIVADIKQMFHQVKVKKADCDALRFLWWPEGDLSKDPADHQMLVHPFGATSSPSCAAYALKRTADDNRSNYDTHIVDTVYRNFYVDDCLKSVASVEEAKELVKLLPEMLAKGGFHLTKWISNCREILALIPEAERASSVMNLDMENLPIDRALGIQWDVEKDAFNFRIGDRLKEETRREMLSFVASVYDPLGFAAPFVLPAKRILQELCRVGYGWDEKVPEDQLSNWREWRKKLPTLMTLAIPRCYKPTGFSQIQTVELHNFSDASLGGYGVASYLRLIDTNGTIHCSLLMGKSRVAPLKAMTVPRLELTAATVAVKVSRQIQDEIQLPIQRTLFWTDSTIVIQYIRNMATRFQTFVSNRLQIIHDASSPSQWYHVSSEFNPADHASRGIKFNGSNEAAITTWFHGAAFLWQPESEWPGQPTDLPEIDRDDKELRRKVQATTITQCNTMGTDVWSRLLHQ